MSLDRSVSLTAWLLAAIVSPVQPTENSNGIAHRICSLLARSQLEPKYLQTWQPLGRHNTTPTIISSECDLFANNRVSTIQLDSVPGLIKNMSRVYMPSHEACRAINFGVRVTAQANSQRHLQCAVKCKSRVDENLNWH